MQTMLLFLLFFLVTVFLGVPIAYGLLASAVFIMVLTGNYAPINLAHKMYQGIDSFPFLAIPFFMLAGEIMGKANITGKLVDFAYSIVGRRKGGLAQVAILTSMVFAAMCGSAVATAAAIGSMLLPSMRQKGYDEGFSSALIASGGAIGPIIPPSIPIIIYASIANVSIRQMFVGSALPGILFGLFLMVYSAWYAKKHNLPTESGKFSWKEFGRTFKEAIIPLIMPVIILGGIFSGIFTATEAACVAVVYALVVGMLVYRTVKLSDLPKLFCNAGRTSASVVIILSTSAVLNYMLTRLQVPQNIAVTLMGMSGNATIVALLLIILILILGCFMDATAIILLLTPVAMVTLPQMGMNMVHFGIVMNIAICVGAITPPVGSCLFVSCRIAKASLYKTSKAVLPMVVLSIFVMLLFLFLPDLTMALPNLVGR